MNATAKLDMIGQRVGILTVLERVGYCPKQGSMYRCRCACGAETIVQRTSLRLKRTRCCGQRGCRTMARNADGPSLEAIAIWRKQAKKRSERERLGRLARLLPQVIKQVEQKREQSQARRPHWSNVPSRFHHPHYSRQRIPDTHRNGGGGEVNNYSPFLDPDTAMWMQVGGRR